MTSVHMKTGTKLHHTWLSQKGRCFNPNDRAWKNYGGRGITMYEGWVNNFAAWLEHVESLPYYGDPDRSLDRVENDKGYEPGNLRWATRIEQANNRRSSIFITLRSETHTAIEWARITGLSPQIIYARLKKGWETEKILNTPGRQFKILQESDMIPYRENEPSKEVGIRYHKLLVLKEASRVQKDKKGKHPAYCYCQCDCGTTKWVKRVSLRSGAIRSCGCSHTTHGQHNSKLYSTWSRQKDRCSNPNNCGWKDYGGRGITFHKAWEHDFMAWKEYVEGLPYYGYPGRSLDRIHNDKGYEPGNLRWATKVEQASNQRSSHLVTFGLETHNIAEWGRLTGLPEQTISKRLSSGWSIGKTLTTPVRKIKRRTETDLSPV